MVVCDLASDKLNITTLLRHESFHLWEIDISGILLTRSKDYVTFSKDGMNVLALGNDDKRMVVD